MSGQPRPASEAAGPSLRPVALAWLLLAALTGLPFARAALVPVPGLSFTGTFYFLDDFYNYLSYVQQAEDGRLLLHNKLAARDHDAVLVNLEWLAVGRLASALGGRPVLAYRLLGLGAALLLVALADRWLRRAGLPDRRRLPALLLVFTGGGLGGVLYASGLLPGERCLDLRTGLFPFVEMLANPHFVIGTALLVAALDAYGRSRPLAGALWGTALGLVRPYDVALLAGVRAVAVLATAPPASWRPRLRPLLGLLPVLSYDAWVFFANPHYRAFSSERYLVPGLTDFLWALGPATVLAAIARTAGPLEDTERAARAHLAAWAVIAWVLVLTRPVSFTLQFLVGMGFPLLALGALGLARRPVALVVAVALFCPTALVTTRLALVPGPSSYAPTSVLRTALAFRQVCRPKDVALAAPEVGLFVGGLTRCWPYVSHRAAADDPERRAAALAFYGSVDPAWRSSFLEREGIAHVALSGTDAVPEAWLGRDTPFRLAARVGEGAGAIGLYSRRPQSGGAGHAP